MSASLLRELSTIEGAIVREGEPMAAHTTYRVGGEADLYVVIGRRAAIPAVLEALAAHDLPWLVLGNGSNVLVADAGIRGAVLHLEGELAETTLEREALGAGQHRLEAGAGLSINRLLRLAKTEDISGVERLGGVPGTVGGAVRMNAGTVLGETSDVLEAAELAEAGRGLRWVPAAELGLSYRRSRLPTGALVTAARFVCTDGGQAMRERLDSVLAHRKATQPLHLPSCGSVFANPPGDYAGRLIEASGLKGRRIGGAEVSEQHANWIVNTGGAEAAEIRALMDLCVREVAGRFGVELRAEVQLVGDWGAWSRDEEVGS